MKSRARGLRVPLAIDGAIEKAAAKAGVSWSVVAVAILADAVRDGRIPATAKDRKALEYLARGQQSP